MTQVAFPPTKLVRHLLSDISSLVLSRGTFEFKIKTSFDKRNETYQEAWYEHCMKSNHPSVLICPNDQMFKIPKYPFNFTFYREKGLNYDTRVFSSVPNNTIVKAVEKLRYGHEHGLFTTFYTFAECWRIIMKKL